MKRAARIGTAFVALLLATACGIQTGSGPLARAKPLTPAEAQAADQTLLRLTEEIDGTIEQRRAGDYLSFDALVEPVRQCMADAGLTYHDPFIDHVYGHQASSNEEPAIAPLYSQAHLHNVRANADLERRDQAAGQWMPPGGIDVGTPYGDAVRACVNVDRGPDNSIRVGYPDLADALQADITVMLDAVDDELGGHKGYDSCMQDQGFGVVSPSTPDGYQGLLALVLGNQPAAQDIPPLGSTDTSAAWDKYVNYYNTAMDADANCRGDTYLEAMALLQPKIEQFQSDHQGDIQRVEQGWAQVVRAAEERGFDPKAPQLHE